MDVIINLFNHCVWINWFYEDVISKQLHTGLLYHSCIHFWNYFYWSDCMMTITGVTLEIKCVNMYQKVHLLQHKCWHTVYVFQLTCLWWHYDYQSENDVLYMLIYDRRGRLQFCKPFLKTTIQPGLNPNMVSF